MASSNTVDTERESTNILILSISSDIISFRFIILISKAGNQALCRYTAEANGLSAKNPLRSDAIRVIAISDNNVTSLFVLFHLFPFLLYSDIYTRYLIREDQEMCFSSFETCVTVHACRFKRYQMPPWAKKLFKSSVMLSRTIMNMASVILFVIKESPQPLASTGLNAFLAERRGQTLASSPKDINLRMRVIWFWVFRCWNMMLDLQHRSY